MRAAAVLRALVLATLATALLLPALWRDAPTAPRPFRVTDGTDAAAIARAALAPLPLVVRETVRPPTEAELDALAAASARAPLLATLPGAVNALHLDPPAHPRATRAAALPFRMGARAAADVLVRLREGGSVIDSVRLRADANGRVAGAFRVRPARAGWREWSVEAEGRTASTGAWVDTAAAPRVLVRPGLPGWESRFVIRALEESGARVDARFDLGRGLAVGEGGDALTPQRLAATDAVLVLDGAPLSGAEAAALAEFAAGGGGVLLAGDRAGAGALGIVRAGAAVVPTDAAALRWTAPAELATLPADRIRLSALPFGAAGPATVLAASSAQGGVLALRPLGRGRAASLALTDSWRWRMEAGRVEEHREFWRSLVDWLSSAPRDALAIRPAAPIGAAGVRQEVAVFGSAAEAILLTRPFGAVDTLRLAPDASRPGVLATSFVPAEDGVHTLQAPGSPTRAAFLAAAAPPGDGWARLAALAHASGGALLPENELAGAVAARTGAASDGAEWPLPWLLLAALVLAAGAEWAIRRSGGRP